MPQDQKATRLLIVDDEQDLLNLLKKVLSKKCDCDIALTTSSLEALELVKNWQPDVVLTDILMPDMDGLQLLQSIHLIDPTISTIIMTGYGTIEIAVQALKDGAYDFFAKPFDNDKISRVVRRALERTYLLRENLHLQQRLTNTTELTGLIGHSPPLRRAIDLMSRLGKSDATVLIRGESGTGKEVAARAIHAMSKRAEKKMITVNCPALPEHILESELFGYCKGAFTGADHNKNGLFLEADGSTILLDEIADLPLGLQTKLLRVLQEKEIQPLGQTKTIKVDVRILAATNQDLEAKMARGEFREDLFYRLNVMTVTLPTLEQIKEDIPLLAQHFLIKYAREYEREGMEFTPEALQCLMRRQWKGNVRQLQNIINRAVLLSDNRKITPQELTSLKEHTKTLETHGQVPACLYNLPYRQAKEEVIGPFTSAYLRHCLAASRGNVTAAAKASDMERQAFQRLMRRYDIDADAFRAP
ncbi:MAG: sigma-54 dependent transcriptional regulator [Desulfoarculaceae bacterium]|nr:sigma-54 dependent transcriptional regulator [Desulfoarculaceae bacterium]